MIGRVTFETAAGLFRPQEDYGILLKTYDVTPPRAKIYRVELDGADGALDFSNWAGDILFETRTVTVELRDMYGKHEALKQVLLGRNAKVTFSDNPDWYYYGRCDEADVTTEKHVSDMVLTYTCQPYRLAHRQTIVSDTVSSSKAFSLKARRMPVIPVINSSGAATIVIDGTSYSLTSGDNSIAAAKLTDTAKTMTVRGNVTVKFTWRDGEL